LCELRGKFCTDSAHAGADGGGISIGDNAEEQDEERERDDPVGITVGPNTQLNIHPIRSIKTAREHPPSIEELPATSNGRPSLTGKHSEIGHGRKTANVGRAHIIAAQERAGQFLQG
jgi:hypothetical protein